LYRDLGNSPTSASDPTGLFGLPSFQDLQGIASSTLHQANSHLPPLEAIPKELPLPHWLAYVPVVNNVYEGGQEGWAIGRGIIARTEQALDVAQNIVDNKPGAVLRSEGTYEAVQFSELGSGALADYVLKPAIRWVADQINPRAAARGEAAGVADRDLAAVILAVVGLAEGLAPSQAEAANAFTTTSEPVNLGRQGTGALGPEGRPTGPGAGGTFVTEIDITNARALQEHIRKTFRSSVRNPGL
jgi:hypothetical protein